MWSQFNAKGMDVCFSDGSKWALKVPSINKMKQAIKQAVKEVNLFGELAFHLHGTYLEPKDSRDELVPFFNEFDDADVVDYTTNTITIRVHRDGDEKSHVLVVRLHGGGIGSFDLDGAVLAPADGASEKHADKETTPVKSSAENPINGDMYRSPVASTGNNKRINGAGASSAKKSASKTKTRISDQFSPPGVDYPCPEDDFDVSDDELGDVGTMKASFCGKSKIDGSYGTVKRAVAAAAASPPFDDGFAMSQNELSGFRTWKR